MLTRCAIAKICRDLPGVSSVGGREGARGRGGIGGPVDSGGGGGRGALIVAVTVQSMFNVDAFTCWITMLDLVVSVTKLQAHKCCCRCPLQAGSNECRRTTFV